MTCLQTKQCDGKSPASQMGHDSHPPGAAPLTLHQQPLTGGEGDTRTTGCKCSSPFSLPKPNPCLFLPPSKVSPSKPWVTTSCETFDCLEILLLTSLKPQRGGAAPLTMLQPQQGWSRGRRDAGCGHPHPPHPVWPGKSLPAPQPAWGWDSLRNVCARACNQGSSEIWV